MMDVKPDKTFWLQYYVVDDSDGIDKEILDHEVEYDCRVTELTTKDLKLLNGMVDSVNNVFKLYTNDEFYVKTGDKARFDGYIYKIIRPYKPVDLSGEVAYTKLYIMKIDG